MKAQMAYFEKWMTGDAVEILNLDDTIDLHHLHFADSETSNQSVLDAMHGYQIMPRTEIDTRYLADRAMVKRLPNLLAICSTGAGYDMIDVEACTNAGIIVCNQSGTNAEAVAEHVFGFMLSLSKKIIDADRAMHTRDRVDRMMFDGRDIFGKTLGIIGIGQIGTRTAQIARAFNMNVLAYDPYLGEADVHSRGAQRVDWDRLFTDSDFITVHCPRNDQTLNMIDKKSFDLMKPTAFLSPPPEAAFTMRTIWPRH